MLIRYNDLLSLIRESLEHELDERAMTHSDAGDGMAMFLKATNDDVSVVLYNAEPMKEGVIRGDDYKKLANNVVAIIYASAGQMSPCFEVHFVAALKGWGPFMYDTAMAHAPNGLMPDRLSVSPAAKNVWQHYYDRADVTKIKLESPVRLHGDKVLDCSYQLTGSGPDTSALQARHEQIDEETEGQLTGLLISSGMRSVQTAFFMRHNKS